MLPVLHCTERSFRTYALGCSRYFQLSSVAISPLGASQPFAAKLLKQCRAVRSAFRQHPFRAEEAARVHFRI